MTERGLIHGITIIHWRAQRMGASTSKLKEKPHYGFSFTSISYQQSRLAKNMVAT